MVEHQSTIAEGIVQGQDDPNIVLESEKPSSSAPKELPNNHAAKATPTEDIGPCWIIGTCGQIGLIRGTTQKGE
jgi:hypothetical protein